MVEVAGEVVDDGCNLQFVDPEDLLAVLLALLVLLLFPAFGLVLVLVHVCEELLLLLSQLDLEEVGVGDPV